MTNKLVVVINKVPKIKKILPYEMKFLVPNYSCLQNPWLGGYRPQIPVLSVLCPQLNLLNPPPNKIPGYATESMNCHWTHTFRTPLSTLAFHALHAHCSVSSCCFPMFLLFCCTHNIFSFFSYKFQRWFPGAGMSKVCP